MGDKVQAILNNAPKMQQGLSGEQQIMQEAALARQLQKLNGDSPTNVMPDGLDSNGIPIVQTQEKILDKFDDIEALKKAYLELEQKQSNPIVEEGGQKSTLVDGEPVIKGEEPIKVVKEVEDNMSVVDKYTILYENQDGQLTDEQYKDLDKLHYPREIVDELISNRIAKEADRYDRVVASVGTPEEYKELMTWAGNNLDASLVNDFNERINSKNETVSLEAINYLQYKQAQMAESKIIRIQGQSIDTSSAVKPFASRADLANAHANPQYGKNAAYTNAVDARYFMSKKKGTI